MTEKQEESPQDLSGPLSVTASAVILLTIAGFPLSIVAWVIYPSLQPGSVTTRLGVALAAWVLLAPIAWLLTRRPKRNGWFLTLIIIAAIGFPLFSYGGLGAANALFDGGASKERRARVLGRKKLSERSNSHPYRLIVRSWLSAGQKHEIVVEGELWRTDPRQVIVLEKPGFFGWPWVGEVRAVPGK